MVCAESGGVCAFPGCKAYVIQPGANDDDVLAADIAHIVAESREGPRGRVEMSAAERNRHPNLMLLCLTHHRVVDDRPLVYSVEVLREIKRSHVERVRRSLAPAAPRAPERRVRDRVLSTLLPISELPGVVHAARTGFRAGEEPLVRRLVRHPSERTQLTPFTLADGRLYAFHDLGRADGPFAEALSKAPDAEAISARALLCEEEGRRRYVALLNRALVSLGNARGLRYDAEHRRLWFPAKHDGSGRSVSYRTGRGRSSKRQVAWNPVQKSTGEPRRFWWHLALALRVERLGDEQWCLSLRPERHLTTDGIDPLPPAQVGRRVTSLKARMYNDLYLAEIHFWRGYLASGRPRLILQMGGQSLIAAGELLEVQVDWPGIEGDEAPFANELAPEDLFSDADQVAAIEGNHDAYASAFDDDDQHDEEDEP